MMHLGSSRDAAESPARVAPLEPSLPPACYRDVAARQVFVRPYVDTDGTTREAPDCDYDWAWRNRALEGFVAATNTKDADPDARAEAIACPFTLQPPHDPVIAASGITFERQPIAAWLSRHDTCPTTKRVLVAPGRPAVLRPNRVVRELAKDLCGPQWPVEATPEPLVITRRRWWQRGRG